MLVAFRLIYHDLTVIFIIMPVLRIIDMNKVIIYEEKLLTIEKTVYGRRDPTGDFAVFRIMIEKLGNRLIQLSARQLQLITYLYGFRTRETPTIIETAKHFHLTERHLKSIERKALNELRDGMNDGRII